MLFNKKRRTPYTTKNSQNNNETPSEKKQPWLLRKEIEIKSFKSVFEIIAIIIAAGWIFVRFEFEESATLEHMIGINVSSQVYIVDDSTVNINDVVNVSNYGKIPFETDSVQIKFWLFPFDRLKKNCFFDIASFMANNKYDFEVIDKTSPVCSHYSVQSAGVNIYNYYVPRNAEKSMIIFYKFFAHHNSFWFSKDEFNGTSYDIIYHTHE